MAGKAERLRFQGALGEQLAARLELPADTPAAFALFAHCFTCSKDLKAVVKISRAMAECGIGVMRFDFTGLGESAGDFAETNFTSNLEDLVAAADYLRSEYGGPQLLVGHSLGGAAILAVAGRLPEALALATIGAPSDTGHLSATLLRQAPHLDQVGEAEVALGGRRFRIRRQLIEDLNEQTLGTSIAQLGRPLLILHSPVDEQVDIDHARRIFERARHPKSFVALDGADHLLLQREEDALWTAEILVAWARRYLSER